MTAPASRAYAYPTFRFYISVNRSPQAAFTECDLPDIELDIEEIKEGGQNDYPHQLPGRRKAARISLKNGVGKSSLLEWYFSVLDGKIERKNVTVALLDSLQDTVMVWELEGAFPFKWTGPQLRTHENTIAIQTLDLVCTNVSISYKGSNK